LHRSFKRFAGLPEKSVGTRIDSTESFNSDAAFFSRRHRDPMVIERLRCLVEDLILALICISERNLGLQHALDSTNLGNRTSFFANHRGFPRSNSPYHFSYVDLVFRTGREQSQPMPDFLRFSGLPFWASNFAWLHDWRTSGF
jgi:hypothetical protein